MTSGPPKPPIRRRIQDVAVPYFGMVSGQVGTEWFGTKRKYPGMLP